MSYYDNGSWTAPGRQPSWEQQPPPSRSGASSAVHGEEASAFRYQFEEVERAQDNLVKSGKMWPAPGGSRRDSMPTMPAAGRGYSDYDARGPQRHSVSEYDGIRSNSVSNVQGYYANQRFQPRPNEADQMMQAKRRMAAQRERELRNYHQEQQYNRSVLADVSGNKSDRSMSPNTMSEDERRELIARQHRALYGDTSNLYTGENTTNRQSSQDARVSLRGGSRGNSPLAYDPFGMQNSTGSIEPAVQMPTRDQMQGKDSAGGPQQRSRANSTSSPSSNQNQSFQLFDAQQSSRTSNSSPGGSPPRQGKQTSGANVAPIGTRPTPSQVAPGAGLQKRSTTPLPSPLSFGYSAQHNHHQNERSNSASSNPSSSVADKGVGLGWGSNSGVWGGKNTLGVQASVWG